MTEVAACAFRKQAASHTCECALRPSFGTSKGTRMYIHARLLA